MNDKPELLVRYIFNREDPVFLNGVLKEVSIYEDEDFKFPKGISYDMKIWHVGETIYVNGVSKSEVHSRCDRCLEPVTLEIKGLIDAIYMKRNPKYDGKTLKFEIEEKNVGELANLIYFDSEKINFSDRIAESILTEIPSKILCKPDCKGLCPVCGTNWNKEKCEHYGKLNDHGIDPRFKILEKYKLKLGE